MNYYETLWNERKGFLKSSALIGLVMGFALSFFLNKDGLSYDVSGTIVCIIIFGVALFLFCTAAICILRMMKAGGQTGYFLGFLAGFAGMCIQMARKGTVGLSISMVLMVVYAGLFLITAAGYGVYLPISSIYYFIRYKAEQKQAMA